MGRTLRGRGARMAGWFVPAVLFVACAAGSAESRSDGLPQGTPEDVPGFDGSTLPTSSDAQLPSTTLVLDASFAQPGDAGVEDSSMLPRDAAASVPDASLARPCPNNTELPLARGLKVRALSLYQTVKVALYENGTWQQTNGVPVVSGKKALLRVFVDAMSGYAQHKVQAVLTLQTEQGELTLRDERTIVQSSSDADRASTFAFPIEGSALSEQTELSLSLHETDCGATAGAAADTRLPGTGSRALDVETIDKLRVVLLPVENAGRTPKLDQNELTKIRDVLLAHYPVADVEVTARSRPLKFAATLKGTNTGAWIDLLNQVMRERSADGVDDDVYYYALLQPAASFASFCGGSCTNGQSMVLKQLSPAEQAGSSLYFTDNDAVTEESLKTIVHELGHMHGRDHAPCVFNGGSISQLDGAFPDRTGATGSWGWDSRSDTLQPPTYKDVMGYCMPAWMSAYTYKALARRSLEVNTLPLIHTEPSDVRWHNVLLYDDGSARWGGISQATMPGGNVEQADVLDAAGRKIANVSIVRLAVSHSNNAMLYLPTLPSESGSVVLADRVLQLERIKQAL